MGHKFGRFCSFLREREGNGNGKVGGLLGSGRWWWGVKGYVCGQRAGGATC